MVKRGLCNTCTRDDDCTFTRKFPVWYCEEFNDYEDVQTDTKKAKKSKPKRRKKAANK